MLSLSSVPLLVNSNLAFPEGAQRLSRTRRSGPAGEWSALAGARILSLCPVQP